MTEARTIYLLWECDPDGDFLDSAYETREDADRALRRLEDELTFGFSFAVREARLHPASGA